MEFPKGQSVLRCSVGTIVVHRAQEVFGAARWWWRHAIPIGRQKSVTNVIWHAGRRSDKRDDRRSRIARDQLGAVQRIGADTRKRTSRAAGELAGADIVGIRPDAVFRIIRKIAAARSGHDGISEISSSWIVRLRNGDAVEKRRGAGRELRYNPAVGLLVVKHNGIARVLGLTRPAESRPKSIVGYGTKKRSSGLVKNLGVNVVHYDDVGRTDVPVGIRWRATAAEVGRAIEGGDRRLDIDNSAQQLGLNDGIAVDSASERDGPLVFVFASAFQLRFRRGHVAQVRRNIKMNHGRNASINGLLRLLRLDLRLRLSSLVWIQSEGQESQEGGNQAKTKTD